MAFEKNLSKEKDDVVLLIGVKIKINWKNPSLDPDEVSRREMIQAAFDNEAVAIAKMLHEEIMKSPTGTKDGINTN